MRPSEELHAFGTFVFLIIHASLQKQYTGLKCNPQSNADIHREATVLRHPLYVSLALKHFLCQLQIKTILMHVIEKETLLWIPGKP